MGTSYRTGHSIPKPIYLDFNATTPVDPLVLGAMLPYFAHESGNASATHQFGRHALAAVEEARSCIAAAMGAGAGSLLFTSGATESDALALLGTWAARGPNSPKRIVTTATEHKAILESAKALADQGAEVVVLGVDCEGHLDPSQLAQTLRTPTLLVSVMAANNETGVISPLREISDQAHAAGALVHTDAAQALGKMPFDVNEAGVDLASLSAHKAYGPKGVGALYVRGGTPIAPLLRGGGQERNLRSGTLNVPGIVGFGAAARLALERDDDVQRTGQMRDELWSRLVAAIPGIVRNGPVQGVLANTLNVRLPRGDADDVLLAVPELGASTGSACAAGSPEPSHVLLAMGVPYEAARASIRFSLGRTTSEADIVAAIELLCIGLERVGMRL